MQDNNIMISYKIQDVRIIKTKIIDGEYHIYGIRNNKKPGKDYRLKDYRTVKILIDVYNNMPVFLNLKKQRYVCKSTGKTITSSIGIVQKRCRISNRIKKRIETTFKDMKTFKQNAKEIITGSLVNISAIVKYIKNRGYDDISIVTLAKPGSDPFEEDKLCAEYIKAKLENKSTDEFKARILNLRYTSGAKFFDNKLQEIYPKKDFYLCTDIDKYDFVLKAKKDEKGYFYMEKILVE